MYVIAISFFCRKGLLGKTFKLIILSRDVTQRWTYLMLRNKICSLSQVITCTKAYKNLLNVNTLYKCWLDVRSLKSLVINNPYVRRLSVYSGYCHPTRRESQFLHVKSSPSYGFNQMSLGFTVFEAYNVAVL